MISIRTNGIVSDPSSSSPQPIACWSERSVAAAVRSTPGLRSSCLALPGASTTTASADEQAVMNRPSGSSGRLPYRELRRHRPSVGGRDSANDVRQKIDRISGGELREKLELGDLDLFRMRLGVAARGDHEVIGYP